MAKWEAKFKLAQRPVESIESVYALKDAMAGEAVYVVAPGPSLDDFPKSALSNNVTIAVNSAAELIEPTFWIFQEGIFCKKYNGIYTSDRINRIVTTEVRAKVICKYLEKPKRLYTYSYLNQRVLRVDRSTGKDPFWSNEQTSFLPGHCSISANGMSLARLMGAKLIVIIGVDLHYSGDKYYADGVKRNTGPRLRGRALSASRAWMRKAAASKVWHGPTILTTSNTLSLRGIKRVSVEKAISEVDKLPRERTCLLKSL
jgi:hypothetical protein